MGTWTTDIQSKKKKKKKKTENKHLIKGSWSYGYLKRDIQQAHHRLLEERKCRQSIDGKKKKKKKKKRNTAAAHPEVMLSQILEGRGRKRVKCQISIHNNEHELTWPWSAINAITVSLSPCCLNPSSKRPTKHGELEWRASTGCQACLPLSSTWVMAL